MPRTAASDEDAVEGNWCESWVLLESDRLDIELGLVLEE